MRVSNYSLTHKIRQQQDLISSSKINMNMEDNNNKPLSHSDLIGVLGKRHVLNTLQRTEKKPQDNISELQSVAGLECESTIALPFLDLLQVPRVVVYQHLFEKSKQKLEKKLILLSNEKLIEMLSVTIRYLGVHELKSLPMSILKKLSPNIPLEYLHFIAKKCKPSFILDEIPSEVRGYLQC